MTRSIFFSRSIINAALMPVRLFYLNKLSVVIMIGIANTSIRKAPTIGTIRYALREGPKRSVTAAMLAIALGVAPRPWPVKPATITAAS